MYWVALDPYGDEETERAFQEAARRCKFFPKPAELIELIEGSSTKTGRPWPGMHF